MAGENTWPYAHCLEVKKADYDFLDKATNLQSSNVSLQISWSKNFMKTSKVSWMLIFVIKSFVIVSGEFMPAADHSKFLWEKFDWTFNSNV